MSSVWFAAMNANEVIANRALELMGHRKGEYTHCDPHDHVNCSQSTNDAYPSALHVGMALGNTQLVAAVNDLIAAFRAKGKEFNSILTMGRTQLQDAVPMGLVFGWLRSVRPTFGRIPDAALWVFDTIGLATFIGIVGLNAGPGFVDGLRTSGPSLLVAGFIVAFAPHFITVLFGHHVLKMNPVILLGACAGAGTATASLRAIQDEAHSKLPVLGYTVPYAVGNILLTAWGPVIVMLLR